MTEQAEKDQTRQEGGTLPAAAIRRVLEASTDLFVYLGPDGKVHFMRVNGDFGPDGRYHVRPVAAQGSHQLAATAMSNATRNNVSCTVPVPDNAKWPATPTLAKQSTIPPAG